MRRIHKGALVFLYAIEGTVPKHRRKAHSNNAFIRINIQLALATDELFTSYNRSIEADLTLIPLLRIAAVLFLRIQNQKEELRSQGIPQE